MKVMAVFQWSSPLKRSGWFMMTAGSSRPVETSLSHWARKACAYVSNTGATKWPALF